MYWSYILMVIGVVGLILMGNKKWYGWLVNLSAQGLWITYGVVTKQYGFVISGLFYAGAYFRGMRKAHKARSENHEQDSKLQYIRGLEDAVSVFNNYGEYDGMIKILTAIETEKLELKPVANG